MKKYHFVFIGLVILGVGFSLGWLLKPQEKQLGGFSSYGQIGVFNSAGITLTNGDGAALQLDAYGRVKMSSTTIISVITP
jgi:hypothetical protein